MFKLCEINNECCVIAYLNRLENASNCLLFNEDEILLKKTRGKFTDEQSHTFLIF